MEVTMAKSTVSAPFVRSPYNYDTVAASDESGLLCEDPSRTSQQFKDECDINHIVELFTRSPEELFNQQRSTPQYGDFTTFPNDYHAAMNQVKAADAAFLQLPASLRAQFDNDPQKLLDFVGDDRNLAKAVELGIVPPQKDLSPPPPDTDRAVGGGG